MDQSQLTKLFDRLNEQKGLIVYLDVDEMDMWVDSSHRPTPKLIDLIECQNYYTSICISGSTGVSKERVDMLARTILEMGYPKIRLASLVPHHDSISSTVQYLLVPMLLNSTIDYFKFEFYKICQKLSNNIDLTLIPFCYLLVEPAHLRTVGMVTQPDIITHDDMDKLDHYIGMAKENGLTSIYLETGSGSKDTIPDHVINHCRENFTGKIVIGGGIRDVDHIKQKLKAGADIFVIGDAIERRDDLENFLRDAWNEISLYNT